MKYINTEMYDQLNTKIEELSDSLNQLRRMGAFN